MFSKVKDDSDNSNSQVNILDIYTYKLCVALHIDYLNKREVILARSQNKKSQSLLPQRNTDLTMI